MRALGVVIVGGLLSACGGEPAQQPPAAAESSGQEAIEPKTDQEMWHHFWDIAAARDAVINADLPAVRVSLSRIASGPVASDMPVDWQRWVDEMKVQADKGLSAQTLAQAASAVSVVASSCAECHRATRGGPELEGDTAGYRPSGSGLREAMARHVWAADELWLGLTAPRHEAWTRGAQALAQMPLPSDSAAEAADQGEGQAEPSAPADAAAAPSAEATAAAKPPEPADSTASEAAAPEAAPGTAAIWEQLKSIRAIGVRAEQAAQPAEKQAVYAEMLTACAECHARVRSR